LLVQVVRAAIPELLVELAILFLPQLLGVVAGLYLAGAE
jgi:putative effector of murein hydrolase LrgA (UPF0299 family)